METQSKDFLDEYFDADPSQAPPELRIMPIELHKQAHQAMELLLRANANDISDETPVLAMMWFVSGILLESRKNPRKHWPDSCAEWSRMVFEIVEANIAGMLGFCPGLKFGGIPLDHDGDACKAFARSVTARFNPYMVPEDYELTPAGVQNRLIMKRLDRTEKRLAEEKTKRLEAAKDKVEAAKDKEEVVPTAELGMMRISQPV